MSDEETIASDEKQTNGGVDLIPANSETDLANHKPDMLASVATAEENRQEDEAADCTPQTEKKVTETSDENATSEENALTECGTNLAESNETAHIATLHQNGSDKEKLHEEPACVDIARKSKEDEMESALHDSPVENDGDVVTNKADDSQRLQAVELTYSNCEGSNCATGDIIESATTETTLKEPQYQRASPITVSEPSNNDEVVVDDAMKNTSSLNSHQLEEENPVEMKVADSTNNDPNTDSARSKEIAPLHPPAVQEELSVSTATNVDECNMADNDVSPLETNSVTSGESQISRQSVTGAKQSAVPRILPVLLRPQGIPSNPDVDSPAAETPVDPKSAFKFPLYPAIKKPQPKQALPDAYDPSAIIECPYPKLTPKKQVSILVNRPPSEEDLPERKRLMAHPQAIAPTSTANYDEKTPLLASTSLPTVVGEDMLPIHPDHMDHLAPQPISSSRSEGGHPPVRRKRRRMRSEGGGFGGPVKMRPLIASPFMPIATTSERRSTISRVETRPLRQPSYGSVRKSEDAPAPSSTEESESEEESLGPRKGSFSSLTSRDWITISMLAVANLCSTIAFSCIAPFYPAEATLKGMTESETGIVFGIFELVMFVTAPLFGRYMTKIGSRNMFIMGLAITGVTAICFGFLNYLPSGRLFFWASLIIRVAEAVGDAAFVTSSFAISAKLFPGNIASIVGVMETFAGLGYTAGPLVGGFLYEYGGGFQTPFLVLGGILLVATGLSTITVEAPDEDEDDVDTEKGMFAMLRIPVIWIMAYAVVVCAVSLSFLDPTLEAHLRTFELTPTVVGLMFLLCGGVYTLSAPVWGVLIDRYDCTNAIMFFGSIATAISMLIIGPSPFLPFDKGIVIIGIALAVLGVAAGALYIPTFQNCLDAVKEYGFDDSIYTYGCVSGVFQSAFAFGGFIGPTLGGAAVQWVGFAWTTTAIAGVNVLFILTLLAYRCGKLCSKST